MRTPRCSCGECTLCKKRTYMRARRAADLQAARAAYTAWAKTKGANYWREHTRRYRANHLEEVRKYDRERKEGQTRPRDPLKRRAQNAVQSALRNGTLKRQPCENCGAQPIGFDGRSLVHAHHDDYNEPLDVRWLCSACHGEVHRAA